MRDSSTHGPPRVPTTADTCWEAIEAGEVLEYDADRDVYRASFDSDSEGASSAVVSAVAAVAGTSPVEMPPLYSVVDPDALETLVDGPAVSRRSSSDTHVSFPYNGYDVTVCDDGTVTVEPHWEDGAR